MNHFICICTVAKVFDCYLGLKRVLSKNKIKPFHYLLTSSDKNVKTGCLLIIFLKDNLSGLNFIEEVQSILTDHCQKNSGL